MSDKRTCEGPATRSAEIASILRDEILGGQYRSGERLPSERDLCDRFSASRGAVREAFKSLEQLGIVRIQPGGARVVPVEDCNLAVLTPLLDLHDLPDPKLVDEVLAVIGRLMDMAACVAVEKATDEQLRTAESIIDEMVSAGSGDMGQHDAVRRLAEFFIEVADHLVLRLTLNGLRTSFIARFEALGIRPQLDSESLRRHVESLRHALRSRDPGQVGTAMRGLNRVFRESAHEALANATPTATRISA